MEAQSSVGGEEECAIVCTLFVPDHRQSIVEDFVAYHLSAGFRHIYLCVDDPQASLDFYEGRLFALFGRDVLSVILPDQGETLQQTICPDALSKASQVKASEVQVRQCLNVNMCLGLAEQAGMHWLLHIDIDELFYLGTSTTLQEHLSMLREENVGALTYANHEAVPTKHECGNYFRELAYFKRHPFQLALDSQTMESLNWWRKRTSFGQYFLGYDCGKSICRIGCVTKAVSSVHTYSVDSSSGLRAHTLLVDARQLDTSTVIKLENDLPCVLHYICSGLDFLREKYSLLGNFADHWKMTDGLHTLPIAPCFHLECRDVVLSGSLEHQRRFFEKQVLLVEGDEFEKASRILIHIPTIAQFLDSLKEQNFYANNSNDDCIELSTENRAQLLRESYKAFWKEDFICTSRERTDGKYSECKDTGSSVSKPESSVKTESVFALSEGDRLRFISQAAAQYL